jgi:hypothetical protein
MSHWATIKYREFWDVPRIFLVQHQGKLFLFDCPFDEATEDYPDQYRVYILPELTDDELAGSWDKLSSQATRFLGEVPVNSVLFDPTKRKEIDTKVLDDLTTAVGIR